MALDKDRLSENAVVASGGWCAPSELLYELGDPGVAPGPEYYEIPNFSVQRGGISFEDNRTEAEKAADAAMQARWRQAIDRALLARHAVIERACVTATVHRWDIHIWEPREAISLNHLDEKTVLHLSHIGIGFEPSKHTVPTIHYHRFSDYWEEWDD